MSATIQLPNANVETQIGPLSLHDYAANDSPLLILSFPSAYNPVAITELGECARLSSDYTARGVKVIGVIPNTTVDALQGFIVDVKAATGQQIDIPLVADTECLLFKALNLDSRMTFAHTVYYGSARTLGFSACYPPSCGRNFHELGRILSSLKITADAGLHTTVNWVPGGDCVLPAEMPDEEADEKYNGDARTIDLPSQKGYLRLMADTEAGEPCVDGPSILP